MDRVMISKRNAGNARMEVCAVNDATDEEILAKCTDNVAGSVHGWTEVLRQQGKTGPVTCEAHPGRLIFPVTC